jgi:SAM-dependent methyltransferase
VRGAYETAADDYAAAFGDDLASLPLDREMLDAAVAAAAPVEGWVLESGCGPAPAAAYLGAAGGAGGAGGAGAAGGRSWLGVDVAGAMLTVAGRRVPTLPLAQADLRRLPLRAGCCALAIAYYSLQHMPRPDLTPALAEHRRVLAPGGVLVLSAHLGEGDVLVEEFLGHRVSLPGCLHSRDELLAAVTGAGFAVEVERQRGPLAHEYASQRLYLLARAA